MKQAIIRYKGVWLEVKGNYTEGDPPTKTYPGSPATFEAVEITTLDNIHELLEDSIEEIEQQVINEL